jgi:histidine triad (HIT) family protein
MGWEGALTRFHCVILNAMDCLFCKIIAGTIPSKKLYEDDQAYAFADIDPKSPVHLLIVPKKHIPSLAETDAADTALLGHLHAVAKRLAAEHNLSGGYRTVINTGPDGGQTVSHLHIHLLGGRQMHWPPG